MDAKTKRMIVGYSRRLSLSWEPRMSAKNKAKVGPALHRCSKCGSYNYEGESKKTFEKYVKQFPEVLVNFHRIEMDHIVPVVQVSGWTSWDAFFKSLFCPEDNYRALCNNCHLAKSHREGFMRRESKKDDKK